MNNKQIITRTSIIFSILAAAGMTISVSSQLIQNTFGQSMMIAVGSAVFGAGLTFFLLRMTTLLEK